MKERIKNWDSGFPVTGKLLLSVLAIVGSGFTAWDASMERIRSMEEEQRTTSTRLSEYTAIAEERIAELEGSEEEMRTLLAMLLSGHGDRMTRYNVSSWWSAVCRANPEMVHVEPLDFVLWPNGIRPGGLGTKP